MTRHEIQKTSIFEKYNIFFFPHQVVPQWLSEENWKGQQYLERAYIVNSHRKTEILKIQKHKKTGFAINTLLEIESNI